MERWVLHKMIIFLDNIVLVRESLYELRMDLDVVTYALEKKVSKVSK